MTRPALSRRHEVGKGDEKEDVSVRLETSQAYSSRVEWCVYSGGRGGREWHHYCGTLMKSERVIGLAPLVRVHMTWKKTRCAVPALSSGYPRLRSFPEILGRRVDYEVQILNLRILTGADQGVTRASASE